MSAIIQAIETILEDHQGCNSRCAAVHLIEFVTTDIANGIDSKYVSGMPNAAADYNQAIGYAADYVREWGA
jgi:hypothetical protein